MNQAFPGFPGGRNNSVLLMVMLALGFMLTMSAQAQLPLVKISTDTFTNPSSQHATEVEPDTFAFGSTLVSAFQVGRVVNGGGADIGFSTSTDGGTTWTAGYLPGLTVNFAGGSASAASDASVAYDAAHGQWLISTLPISNNDVVATSRSMDGINWENPVVVSNINADKNWIVCDNTVTSPFYGHCYSEWDSPAGGDIIEMSTSTDGGLSWGPARETADHAAGIGGQPLVRPDGTVVVPIIGLSGSGGIGVFTSTNGGTSWSKMVSVANITDHGEAGGIRSGPLPSAEIDGAGKVYVVWSDCRFRSGCSSNDIVMITSADAVKWTKPARIPIDPASSTVDHFITGLGVDPATSGSTAHLTLTYYFYPVSNCNFSTCKLGVGFVDSQDGGKTWTRGKKLAGPMRLSWLPDSQNGLMVADYISTSYVEGKPFAVFAVAKAKSGSIFDEAMYTTSAPLLASNNEPRFSSKGEKPIPGAKSDHGPMKFYDLDHEYPIPPPNKSAKRSAKK
jgi:hypothetical protein